MATKQPPLRHRVWPVLLSLIIFALPLLASCAVASDTPEASETDTSQPPTSLYDDLPEAEGLNGYQFRVLQYEETTAATGTVLTEKSSDAPISQALYRRMVTVEDRLGVTFVNVTDSLAKTQQMLSKSVQGNLDEFDVYWGHSTSTVTNFLSKGQLRKLNTIVSLDFDKPWWDDTANQNLAIGDDLYMAFGDVNLYLFDFHSTLVFNRTVAEDHHWDLYQMVEDGTWTMDAFTQFVTETALPAPSGNGYDRTGFAGYAYATMFGFLHGADVSLFRRDENHLPIFTSPGEEYRSTLVNYSRLFQNKDICQTDSMTYLEDFINEKVSVISCAVGELGTLRPIDRFDYGLLPFPKRTARQPDYISFVSNQIQPMVIPITARAENLEKVGTVLEHLAAESYRQVRPEYFDVMLKYKYVRDPASMAILENIFLCETRFEIEQIYGWADFDGEVVSALTSRKSERFTSTVQSYRERVRRAILRTLDDLKIPHP